MHTALLRLNSLATFSALLLGAMLGASSFLGAIDSHSFTADAEVIKINRLWKQFGNDEASLSLNISMDLEPLFTLNTKQVFVFLAAEYQTLKNSFNQISLWDHIVTDNDHAKFQIQTRNKYPFIDQGHNLCGKKVELVLHLHIMPKTGKMIYDRKSVSSFHLPEAYTI